MANPPPARIDAGIFNVAQPNYSASTVQLMKVLMEETKVPHRQQKLFQQSLRSGKPLPEVQRHCLAGGRRQRPPARQRTADQCGRRSQDTIASLEDGYPDLYRPPPGRDREAERERLAHVMTHGRNARPDLGGPAPEEVPDGTPPPKSRFDELWTEVEDRRTFLSEMKQLGRGKEYELIIRTEVARLVQEMEQLQKEDEGAAQ